MQSSRACSQDVAKSPDTRERWRTETPKNSRRCCAGGRVRTLADWRQNTENLGVAGSIPALSTESLKFRLNCAATLRKRPDFVKLMAELPAEPQKDEK